MEIYRQSGPFAVSDCLCHACKEVLNAFLDNILQEGYIINSSIKYATKTTTTLFQGKAITVNHLTPVLTPEERAVRKREIERRLYEVFVKYSQPKRPINGRGN